MRAFCLRRQAGFVDKDVIVDTEKAFDECSVTGCLILCASLGNRNEYWWRALQFSKEK